MDLIIIMLKISSITTCCGPNYYNIENFIKYHLLVICISLLVTYPVSLSSFLVVISFSIFLIHFSFLSFFFVLVNWVTFGFGSLLLLRYMVWKYVLPFCRLLLSVEFFISWREALEFDYILINYFIISKNHCLDQCYAAFILHVIRVALWFRGFYA